VNYEMGARFRRGGLHLQGVGFFSDYGNILGRATLATGESGTGDLFNGGDVGVLGVELSGEWDPFRGRAIGLPLRIAYTYTHAEFKTGFESDFEPWGTVEPGDRLPYLPEHQLFAEVGARGPRWSASVSAAHNSAMRTVAGQGPIPDGQGTDSFLTLSLSGDYRVTQWSSIFVAVQNLTDERYVVARRPAGARPGLPRTILAGVKLSR
jgi:Fe(3+) dicitrate transport protein